MYPRAHGHMAVCEILFSFPAGIFEKGQKFDRKQVEKVSITIFSKSRENTEAANGML